MQITGPALNSTLIKRSLKESPTQSLLCRSVLVPLISTVRVAVRTYRWRSIDLVRWQANTTTPQCTLNSIALTSCTMYVSGCCSPVQFVKPSQAFAVPFVTSAFSQWGTEVEGVRTDNNRFFSSGGVAIIFCLCVRYSCIWCNVGLLSQLLYRMASEKPNRASSMLHCVYVLTAARH